MLGARARAYICVCVVFVCVCVCVCGWASEYVLRAAKGPTLFHLEGTPNPMWSSRRLPSSV